MFPVAFHLTCYFGRARFQRAKVAAEAALAAELDGSGDAELAKASALPGGAAEAAGDAPADATSGGNSLGPSPFDMAAAAAERPANDAARPAQLRGRSRLASAAMMLQALPEHRSLDMAAPGSLQLAPSQQGRSVGSAPGVGQLTLELLHAATTTAPQRSKELDKELQASVDRQALFRETLLATTLLPRASRSLSLSTAAAVSRRLSLVRQSLVPEGSLAGGLPSAERDELVLALLPPYRRSRVRHPVVEAALELGLPAVVLGMGLFFSVSTLVLLFS